MKDGAKKRDKAPRKGDAGRRLKAKAYEDEAPMRRRSWIPEAN